ncbi:RyR domain-containing protein [Micromonospora avicenniae]|uniref:RyR domain-containing protein n=1 Tax=Micromonospora avicenniae TaxID=1198245 RepID=A0A1N7E6F7_9ACTN|nr:RyR domain-containing protein [Micromonospora avicenniae]SIR83624.1 RyR domain-containing protein [Micromonospora avicenniae]
MAVPARGIRALTAARWGLVATVVAALALGLWGLRDYTSDPRHETNDGLLDLIYYDLQLFVLGSSPLEAGGPIPWPLQIARFLAPAATVYFLFEAARAMFADTWRVVRQRNMSGHAIVTGKTPTAAAIAAELQASGRRVIRTETGDAGSLYDAGVQGARVLYACADDSTDSSINVLAAATASRARRARKAGPLAVYAQVSDPAYALALRARHLSQPNTGSDFFNTDELAARELVRRDAATFEDAVPHVVIAGLGAFGQALVVELARMWQLSPRCGERLSVTLVDPAAEIIADDLRRRWPAVVQSCLLRPFPGDLRTAVDDESVPPHRTYLCFDDEDASVLAALTLAPLWRGGPHSLVLPLDRLARLVEVFGQDSTTLLDDIEGQLWPISVGSLIFNVTPGESGTIHEDIYERLAQSIHHIYLQRRVAQGARLGDTAAMVPWERLETGFREANLQQARNIGAKLIALGYTVAPRTGSGVDRIDDTLIESLAVAEHDRWVAERISQGWRFGEVRDDRVKLHPSIKPWGELSEAERDKDRDVVRDIPLILADYGLQVVRLTPPAVAPPTT